ncbi:DUF5719 family protein [Arcanobacterium bovis]|nr:DUF5719 family protein [Arcanobacterium bovis]
MNNERRDAVEDVQSETIREELHSETAHTTQSTVVSSGKENHVNETPQAPQKAKVRRRMPTIKLRTVTSMLAVLGVGAALGVGVLNAPEVKQQAKSIQLVAPQGGTQAMACTDGLHPAISGGTSIGNVDQQIAGWAGMMYQPNIDGDPIPALTWKSFGGESLGFTKNLLAQAQIPVNTLGVRALNGSVLVERTSEEIGDLMGSSMHRANAGDLRGLASNPCQWAQNSAWLVGSNTQIGTSNRLAIANPGTHPIQVNVEAYTSVGRAELGANKYINVAPGSTKSLALDGIVPADPRIALRLSTDSGKFVASLQSLQLEGYKPKGVDFIKSGNSGRTVFINGLYLPPGKSGPDVVADTRLSQQSDLVDPHVKGSIRVVNAEKSVRTVKIKTVGAHGEINTLPGGESVTIAPEATLDLTLDGMKAGDHSLIVEADGEISAGARVAYVADSGETDVSWLAPQRPFNNGGAAVGFASGRLIITADSATTVTWTAYKEDGVRISSADVEVSGVTPVGLPDGTAYVTLSSSDPVYASVAASIDINGAKGIDWIPITSNTFDSSSVRVRVQN